MPMSETTRLRKAQEREEKLTDAYLALADEGANINARSLRERSGVQMADVVAFLQQRRGEAGIPLSPRAQEKMDFVREEYPFYGSESEEHQHQPRFSDYEQATSSLADTDGLYPGAEWEAAGSVDGAGGTEGRLPGRQRNHREPRSQHDGKNRGAQQHSRRVPETPSGDGDDAGRDQKEPGLGSRIARGAHDFYERTKENITRQHDSRPKKTYRKLSKQEAEDIHDEFSQSLRGIWGLMDQGIYLMTGMKKEVEIWSTIDDGDLESIVEGKLRRAQYSAKEAQGVYRTIDIYSRLLIYGIYGPRMWQTMEFIYQEGLAIPIQNPFGSSARRRRRMRVVEDSPAESVAQ